MCVCLLCLLSRLQEAEAGLASRQREATTAVAERESMQVTRDRSPIFFTLFLVLRLLAPPSPPPSLAPPNKIRTHCSPQMVVLIVALKVLKFAILLGVGEGETPSVW